MSEIVERLNNLRDNIECDELYREQILEELDNIAKLANAQK